MNPLHAIFWIFFFRFFILLRPKISFLIFFLFWLSVPFNGHQYVVLHLKPPCVVFLDEVAEVVSLIALPVGIPFSFIASLISNTVSSTTLVASCDGF